MGPYKEVISTSQKTQWAHSWPSAPFLLEHQWAHSSYTATIP